MRKIVISTGGGDAPGLNAVIFAVVNSAARRGWEVYGSRTGYRGLLDLDDLVRLTPEDVEGITPIGGTILGNTAVGILYGWCYWKRSLVSAMVAHFAVDIMIHVLPAFAQ